ncbi:putative metal-dependent phosphoesterase (PHP family) [Candidatus Paraburkholderia calva]|nr:putative metal-dependent phosphoesterase (PHP family) [Candidatus Paraburkholderia calva]
MNADLHCHSTVSDGQFSPADVAARAHAGGVTLWSLTDHDQLGGQREAREAAEALGMGYLPGVEISVTWAGRTIHVVGMSVDPDNAELRRGLELTRNGRAARGVAIGEALAAVGIPDAYEGALRHTDDPDMISRTHFARFLVEQGYAKSTSEVFACYLGDGKPGFVGHRWAKLADCMQWIRNAGGEPIIAHPGRYDYTPVEFSALFDEFIQMGGRAIEVVTGSHTPDQYREYADVARRYGFEASRGSDFHGAGEGRVDLGQLSPLPDDLKPVWERWL